MYLPREEGGQKVAAATKHGRQGDIFRSDSGAIHAGKEADRLVRAVGEGVCRDHSVPCTPVPGGHFIEELAGVRRAAAARVRLDGAVEEEDGGGAGWGERDEVGFHAADVDEGAPGGT